MYIGAAYYPEHISVERIRADAELMEAAGVNLVRMGEFAWCFLEPDDGRFDFSWLDAAIEILAAHGVRTLLCTPTASPPKWLLDKHPDVYQVYENGQRREWGRRREYCVNNKNYHFYTRRIVAALAGHYHDNPNVIGYQLDNEFMAEKPYCYCSTCRGEFQTWLKQKFGSIQEFNRRCGTAFWGLSYRDWNEIELPRSGENPSLMLEMYRFFSNSYLEYARLQTDLLHWLSPGKPVTHNICSSGFMNNLDLYGLGKIVDIAALDNYPLGWTLETELHNPDPLPYDPAMASLALAYTRAVRGGEHFWVTEKQIGPGGGRLLPGFPRLWTYQEYAHGGRLFLFFPWRACPFGVEHALEGVLDHDSVPRRRYAEVQHIARELKAFEPEIGETRVDARVAILRDFDCDWALTVDPVNAQFRYQRLVFQYSQALFRSQIQYDVVSAADDWSGYRLLIVPALLMVAEPLAQKLSAYALNGGTLVLTFLSGLRDQEAVVISETFPGKLRELAGVEIEEQDNLEHTEPAGIHLLGKEEGSSACRWWCDVLKPVSAQTLAVYDEQSFYGGAPAITANAWGSGRVIYIGTQPDQSYLQKMLLNLAKSCGIERPVTCASPLVEVVQTRRNEETILFVLNFSQQAQVAIAHQPFINLADRQRVEGAFSVAPMDVLILKTNKECV